MHAPLSSRFRPLVLAAPGLAALLTLAGGGLGALGAQLIPIETVPVAQGDQFLLHPSRTLGMGGLTLALDDPLRDPFVNPAKGSRLERGRVAGAPVYYTISGENGAGRTLPVAVLGRGGRRFGGVSAAIQEIRGPDERRALPWLGVVNPSPTLRPPGAGQRLSERSNTNTYLSAYGGWRLDSRWAVAASVAWADLNAVDGVEHLYANARSLSQSGGLVDLRLGVVRDDPDGGSFEALVLHDRFDMTHRVETLRFATPDSIVCVTTPCGIWEWRREENLDRTRTTGAHVGWTEPVGGEGWTLGAAVTVNRKEHPKIPDYEIQSVPRDPGDSWAWRFGLGLARSRDAATYGIDLVVEPIWTDTWSEAEAPVTTSAGDAIPPGGRTVENEFFFRNARLRVGAAHAFGPAEARLGLAVRSVSYDLEQEDRIRGGTRDQSESWTEWSPSVGGSLRLSELRIEYTGRLTTGTGRPGTAGNGFGPEPAAAEAAGVLDSDFVPAPGGALTLQDARVWTHQLTVAIPIG